MNIVNRIKNRMIYHSILKIAEFRNSKKKNIRADNTFLIFSNPRGGSTWLAELLSEMPNAVLCLEPLQEGKLKEFEQLNFFCHQPIPSGEKWNEAEEVFGKLFNRELLRLSMYYENNLLKLAQAKNLIVKFCHGNMLLEWVADHFDVNPIFLVRHPCAVVSSQLLHGGWQSLKQGKVAFDIPEFPYNEVYYQYEDILKTVKTIEENLAATWCLTMSNSLKSPSNNIKWVTLAYESLYTHFEAEIDRLFTRLQVPIPAEIYNNKKRISQTTIKRSEKYILSGQQLCNWKDQLSKKQQLNIMGIVKEFGIDCYDLSPEPDLNKMYAHQEMYTPV